MAAQYGAFNTNANGPLDMSTYISGLGDQFNKSWKNQDDQLQFAKDQFAKTSGTTDKVVDRAMDTSARFRNYSATDRDVYEGQYMPAMKEQLDFARNYTTPGRAAANRAGAIAQSNISFDTVGDSLRRGLQSYGVDPSAGRYAGLDAGLAAKKAMSAAAAGTKSDRDTEMLGQQYLANAIRTGQTLPGQSTTEANVSMAAGNQGVNAGLAQGTAGMSWEGTPLQWNQQGNTMYNMWPGAANLQYQAGRQSNQDTFNDNLAMMKFDQGSSSGAGAAIGAGFGALGSIGKMVPWGQVFGSGGGGEAGSPTGPGSIGGGGSTLGDSGNWAAKGGRIRRFRRGGPVTDVPQGDDDMDDLGLTPAEHEARRGMFPGHAEGGTVPGYYYGGDVTSTFGGIGGASGQPWDEGGAQGNDSASGGSGGWDPGGQYEGAMSQIPMVGGYISDAAGAIGEFSDGDQGETESPQTPMDPAANMWDSLSGKPREKYDEAERRGSKVGRFVGRFGSYFTGGMGGDAWAEGGGRLGGGIGAATEGDWKGAFDDVVQGTPLTFLRSARGGPITSGVGDQGDGGGDGASNMVPPGASPSGGEKTDDVPAMVSVDEFVFPKDAAKWYGEKYLQNMIEKARRDMSTAKAQPEPAQIPQAIAMQPPSFRSEGARA